MWELLGLHKQNKKQRPPLAGFLFSPLRLTVCMGRDVEGLPHKPRVVPEQRAHLHSHAPRSAPCFSGQVQHCLIIWRKKMGKTERLRQAEADALFTFSLALWGNENLSPLRWQAAGNLPATHFHRDQLFFKDPRAAPALRVSPCKITSAAPGLSVCQGPGPLGCRFTRLLRQDAKRSKGKAAGHRVRVYHGLSRLPGGYY